MQILGIRVSPSTIRYAVLEWNGKTASFLNADEENKLNFPANVNSCGEKMHWLHQELMRVLDMYPEINVVGIKEGEYQGMETAGKRERARLEGSVQLWAHQNNLTVDTKIYGGIRGIRSNQAVEFCENNIGRSATYWNKDMTDALVVAWALKDG